MSANFTDLNLVVDAVFDIFTDVFSLYTSSWILASFLMFWVVKKVARLFQRL